MGFNTTAVLVVLGVYLAFMVYLGFFFKERTSSFADFITGSSNVPWFVLTMTMLATLANAQQTLGIAGTSYGLGLSPMIWYFVIVNMIIYPLIKRLGSRYRQLNFLTVVDLADARFEHGGRLTLLLAIWQIAWGVISTAICIFGGGLVLQTVFGISMWIGILITGVITVFYCVMGGFKSVIFTDTIQWLIILFGTAALIPATFIKYGSFSNFFSTILGPSGYAPSAASNLWPGFSDLFSLPSFAGVTPVVLIAMGLAGSLWIPIDLSFVQRMLSAKTPKDGRRSSFTFLAAVTFWACIMVAMGLFGAQLFPGVANTDSVILLMANDVMPGIGMAIFVAAIAAAVMSTVDSYLNATAAIFTRNIYKRFINKDATDKQMIKNVRIMTVVVAVAALLFAPLVAGGGVFGTAITAQMVLCASVTPVILLSTYWKRLTEPAAFWGCLVSGVVTLAIVLFAGGGQAVFFGAGIFGVPAIFVGLIIGFLIYIVITFLTPYDESKIGKDFLKVFNDKKSFEKSSRTDLYVIAVAIVLLLVAIFTKKKESAFPPLSGTGGILTDVFFWAVTVIIAIFTIYILIRSVLWAKGLQKAEAAAELPAAEEDAQS